MAGDLNVWNISLFLDAIYALSTQTVFHEVDSAYVMLVGECTLMQAKKCIVMLQIHAIRKIYSIAIVQCMLVSVLGELPM